MKVINHELLNPGENHTPGTKASKNHDLSWTFRLGWVKGAPGTEKVEGLEIRKGDVLLFC